jgi:hypothetical protein
MDSLELNRSTPGEPHEGDGVEVDISRIRSSSVPKKQPKTGDGEAKGARDGWKSEERETREAHEDIVARPCPLGAAGFDLHPLLITPEP